MFTTVYYQGRKSCGEEIAARLHTMAEGCSHKNSLEVYQEEESCRKRLEKGEADLVILVVGQERDGSRKLARMLYEQGRGRQMILLVQEEQDAWECLAYYPFQVVLLSEEAQVLPEVIREYLRGYYRHHRDIKIATRQGTYWLDSREIYYLESWGHQLTARCEGEKQYVFRGTLKQYEALLESCGFVRVHMSYLVNLRHCRSIEKEGVFLKDGNQIPLSRDRREYVRKLFEEYYI